MEAHHYPIFATLYHPESKIFPVFHLTKDITDEIAFRLSLLLNRWARKNSNKVHPDNKNIFYSEMAVDRVPSYLIKYNIMYAYIYQKDEQQEN